MCHVWIKYCRQWKELSHQQGLQTLDLILYLVREKEQITKVWKVLHEQFNILVYTCLDIPAEKKRKNKRKIKLSLTENAKVGQEKDI